MTYSDTRMAVPDWYWDDDCPCAKAGEYQPDCHNRLCHINYENEKDQ